MCARVSVHVHVYTCIPDVPCLCLVVRLIWDREEDVCTGPVSTDSKYRDNRTVTILHVPYTKETMCSPEFDSQQ